MSNPRKDRAARKRRRLRFERWSAQNERRKEQEFYDEEAERRTQYDAFVEHESRPGGAIWGFGR